MKVSAEFAQYAEYIEDKAQKYSEPGHKDDLTQYLFDTFSFEDFKKGKRISQSVNFYVS